MARQLAREGTDLVLVALEREPLERLAGELRAEHGVDPEVLVADLRDPDALAGVAHRLEAADPVVDLLVNAAGTGSTGPFVELSADAEEQLVRVNCLALLRLCHAAAPGMVSRRSGAILNVSSLTHRGGASGTTTYAASKAFVSVLSTELREELRGSGVTVTVIEPGLTRTGFHERMVRAGPRPVDRPARLTGLAWQWPEAVARTALEAVRRGDELVVPGVHNRVAVAGADLVPPRLRRWAVRRWVQGG